MKISELPQLLTPSASAQTLVMDAGTTYRTEFASGGGSAVVQTLPADAGEVAFDNLTGSRYRLTCDFQLSADGYLYIAFDGDLTASNYRRQALSTSSTSINASVSALSACVYNYSANSSLGIIDIVKHFDGRITAHATYDAINGVNDAESAINAIFHGPTALASISLAPPNGIIKSGSRFILEQLPG